MRRYDWFERYTLWLRGRLPTGDLWDGPLGAVIVLGEVLSAQQWLGGALVIGTLIASSLLRKTHGVPPPPGRPV